MTSSSSPPSVPSSGIASSKLSSAVAFGSSSFPADCGSKPGTPPAEALGSGAAAALGSAPGIAPPAAAIGSCPIGAPAAIPGSPPIAPPAAGSAIPVASSSPSPFPSTSSMLLFPAMYSIM